ncbi:hypothetical protein [Deinococcus altitudinis]|uniref:hypothetical protein n=1 Tax=Deinococcus altitudinis TaxID=468914 RepID=UPI00389295AF
MAGFQRIPVRPGAEPYEAVAYCDNQGWTLLAKRTEEQFLHYIFDSGGGQVHVMWDHAVKKYFFTLIGENAAEIAEDIYALSETSFHPLEVCTEEEALTLAMNLSDPADIYYACLIANDLYDERVLQCYERAFSSPDPEVRFFACASCGSFVDWEKEIRPLLNRVRERDSDASVRQIAEQTLTALDAHDCNRGERLLSN